jgi:Uma2 family endonuclease
VATTTDPLTLEAYAVLDEIAAIHVTELVRGWVREPRPGTLHARVQFRHAYHLSAWVRENRRGEVYGESGLILSDNPATLRGPDAAVDLRPHTWRYEPGEWIRGALDLAVEVVSSSDTSRAMHEKVLDYLDGGAEAVWIVDPHARTGTVYHADGSTLLLHGNAVLTLEDLLPGFALPLSELFGGTEGSASSALRIGA